MDWANNWIWGLPLLVATVVVHVTAFMVVTKAMIPEIAPSARRMIDFNVSVAVLAMFAAVLHSLEALAWAYLYVYVGALPNMAEAIVYSLNAITAFGHTQEYLSVDWRLLGAIEAVNGLILFGLTTAFFFAAIQNAWPGRSNKP